MEYIKIKKIKSEFISSILDELNQAKNKSTLLAIHGIRQIKQMVEYLEQHKIEAKAFMLNEDFFSKYEEEKINQEFASILNYLKKFSNKIYIVSNAISRKLSPEVKRHSAFLIITKQSLSNFYSGELALNNFLFDISNNKKSGLKLLYLEEIQDPGNLGTIIRTATAFNFDGILLGKNSVSIFNDKVLSSSLSAVLTLPIYESANEVILKLKNSNFKLLTFDMGGIDLEQYIKFDYNEKINYILAFGNEGNGISNYLLNNSDSVISINMTGVMESLNVAIACAIAMYRFI